MRHFTLFILCLLSYQIQAQIIITDDDLQGGNTYNWTNENEYILDGIVVLEEGGVLNIQAGTVIKGKASPTDLNVKASALIISKGAKIHAIGSQEHPVIFTAEIDDVNNESDITYSDRGLWGGLILLGDAPIAAFAPSIPVLSFPDTEPYRYGGNNATDSSGVLSYVSIRHPGAEALPDEELDGLYLGGVGSRTVINNIEVYAGKDDAITISGGTVNLKYLSVAFNTDESIDWDRGWRGKGQFWLALQDEESNRCGEHDGASPDLEDPFSKPVVSNVTYIGPGMDAEDSASEALIFRDRSGGVYTNSIFIHFPKYAIAVEDRSDITDSYDHLQTGDLLLNCNYWWDFGAGNAWTDLVNVSAQAEDTTAAFLINLMETNQNTIADPMITNLDTDPSLFDPRLSPNSPALNAACTLNDPFFDPVNYIGAFDSESIWLNTWSGMDANQFFAYITTDVREHAGQQNEIQVYPNPGASHFLIEGLSEGSTIRVFDLDGRMLLSQKTSDSIFAVDAAQLNEGMYLLQIQDAEGVSRSEKITVLR